VKGEKVNEKKDKGFKRDFLWVSTLGINLVVSSIAGTGLGYGIDHVFKTQPVFTISLFFIGTFAGFRQIYKEIIKMSKEDGKKNDGRR
jgi:F0F1-type ATP synthase assembly protein I